MCLFASIASFAQTFESGGILYEVTSAQDKFATLIWGGDCKGDLVLPASVTYDGIEYRVYDIEDRAFNYCEELKSIVIPEGVTRIGEETFNGCSSLTSVEIPESMAFVDSEAFSGCYLLSSVKNYTTVTYSALNNRSWFNTQYDNWFAEQPEGLVLSGNVALTYKGTLPSTLDIPEGVTHIADGAFANSNELTSVTIPSSVISIGQSAFENCVCLATINIPENIKSVGQDAFKNTAWYSNQQEGLVCLGNIVLGIKGEGYYDIEIPDGMKLIADKAFDNNKSINTVIIPSSIEILGRMSFSSTNIHSVSMSEGIKSIGMCAFWGCSNLERIFIPQSVSNIGNGTFQSCKNLVSVNIPEKVTCIRDDLFSECSSLTSVDIPEGVVSIGEDAFEKCYLLSKINIPDKVKRIGKRSFSGCNQLASPINIPQGVKTIENNAFYNCSTIPSITFSEGLTKIGDNAFSYCSSLESLKLPESLSFIGVNAFFGCGGKMKSIVVASGNSKYDSRNNCNALIEKSTSKLLLGCNTTVIPDGITSIESGAFSYCKELKSLSVPESVTSIGENAFNGCSELTSINIPNGLTSISNYTFYSCALSSVIIPDGITKIGDFAFANNTNLNTIVIPSSVIYIGASAFDKCPNISSFTCLSVNPDKISIEGRLFSYEYNIFQNCTLYVPVGCKALYRKVSPWYSFEDIRICHDIAYGIDVDGISYEITSSNDKTASVVHANYKGSVVIPSKVVIDGIEYSVNGIASQAFCDLEELTSLYIPRSITVLPANTFDYCFALTDLKFEDSPEIQKDVFATCPNIRSVTSAGTTPGKIFVKNPFCGGDDYERIIVSNGVKKAVEDSDKGRSLTEIDGYDWTCSISMDSIPAGTYKVKIGIMPVSTEDSTFYVHPSIQFSGFIDGSYITEELYNPKKKRGARYMNVYYTTDSLENNILTTEAIEVPPVKGMKLTVNFLSGVNENNCDKFSSRLLIDRIIFEPLDNITDEVMAGYVGPFAGEVFNNAVLYVPESSLDSYRSAQGWSYFKNIAIDTNVKQVSSLESNPVIYDIIGRKVGVNNLHELQPGLYIIGNKKFIKM